jgi:hypothetical protein
MLQPRLEPGNLISAEYLYSSHSDSDALYVVFDIRPSSDCLDTQRMSLLMPTF